MASCGVCKKTVLFGGVMVGVARYCSQTCADQAKLTPPKVAMADLADKPVKPIWTVLWAVLAILAFAMNMMIELASWPKHLNPQNALSSAFGFAIGPFLMACLCLFFKEHRNWHSYFKTAAIIAVLLVFAGIGKIAPLIPR
jgi:MFS family permease